MGALRGLSPGPKTGFSRFSVRPAGTVNVTFFRSGRTNQPRDRPQRAEEGER